MNMMKNMMKKELTFFLALPPPPPSFFLEGALASFLASFLGGYNFRTKTTRKWTKKCSGNIEEDETRIIVIKFHVWNKNS